MNWYKHYIGDFQRDTGHLSLTERGAYRAMLDHHYATEKPLPRDVTAICRLVGTQTKTERDAVQRVLGEFWNDTPDGWTNDRAEKEIAKADKQRGVNRGIAEERERKRKSERTDDDSHDEQCDEPQHETQHDQSTNRATDRSTETTIRARVPDTRHQTKGSEANASAAGAAPVPDEPELPAFLDRRPKPNGTDDPVKALFDLGIATLAAGGTPEKQARSLVGKWRKETDDERLLALFLQARRDSIVEPVAWLTQAVARASRRGERRPSAMVVGSPEWEAEQELNRKRALGLE